MRACRCWRAINAFSQGIAYYHAGIDTLRSKSMDRNSYNRATGSTALTGAMPTTTSASARRRRRTTATTGRSSPLLANAAIKPGAGEIGWTRDAFRDLLAIRASSTLFRLRTAEDVKRGLAFRNTGSVPGADRAGGPSGRQRLPRRQLPRALVLRQRRQASQALVLDADKGQGLAAAPGARPKADRRPPTTRVTSRPAAASLSRRAARWSTLD